MGITKLITLANLLDVPVSNCYVKKDNRFIIVVNNEKEYLAVSEYGHRETINVASRYWHQKIVWKYPIEFIIPYTIDEHRGFTGIKNENLIQSLKKLQLELKEDFNELALSMIKNKSKFYKNAIKEFGYNFIFQPIDNQELIANGFRFYRLK